MLIAVSQLESLSRRTCLTAGQPQMHASKTCGFLALVRWPIPTSPAHLPARPLFLLHQGQVQAQCAHPSGQSADSSFLNCPVCMLFLVSGVAADSSTRHRQPDSALRQAMSPPTRQLGAAAIVSDKLQFSLSWRCAYPAFHQGAHGSPVKLSRVV